ncbi:MAG: hypothetical protein M9939_20545 [Mesorhizobium sp.]|nr:hypothetical protein [Mesorhizobium sp.]MCO5163527.1 hypothetical protein [Mesorhizobium sp.]
MIAGTPANPTYAEFLAAHSPSIEHLIGVLADFGFHGPKNVEQFIAALKSGGNGDKRLGFVTLTAHLYQAALIFEAIEKAYQVHDSIGLQRIRTSLKSRDANDREVV